MDAKTGEMSGSGCPVNGGVRSLLGRQNRDWWPDALAVDILAPNGAANPMGDEFNYAEAFKKLDYKGLKAVRTVRSMDAASDSSSRFLRSLAIISLWQMKSLVAK